MSLILIIIILFLVFGGVGYWGRSNFGYWGGGGFGIGSVLLILLVLYLLGLLPRL